MFKIASTKELLEKRLKETNEYRAANNIMETESSLSKNKSFYVIKKTKPDKIKKDNETEINTYFEKPYGDFKSVN